jgi:hypothetical protein
LPSPPTAIETLHVAVLAAMCVLVSSLPPRAGVPLAAWFAMLMALTLAVPGLVAKFGEWVRFVTAGLVLLSVYEALEGSLSRSVRRCRTPSQWPPTAG